MNYAAKGVVGGEVLLCPAATFQTPVAEAARDRERGMATTLRPVLLVLVLVASAFTVSAQTTLTGRVDRAIKAAGVPIVGVSIGDPANKATWRVSPSSLQTAAQPMIDAFNASDPAHALAEADARAAIEYRYLNRLATFAVMAEAYNPAWAAMTNAQRRAEIVRLAKRWEQQRNWVTRNYEFMVW